MVGSDLERDGQHGSYDLWELLTGYDALTNGQEVEVIVAFGGADKDGWRGMKFANISQLQTDLLDEEFGNEIGPDAYLYRADGAHMGDQSSLMLFLDYLRDGYVNFDQRFLTFWDHGNSFKGFGNDSNFNDDPLSMDEMQNSFAQSDPGTFDLIGFDACLMASVEVAKIFEPHADYMIASADLEPGHGWLWSEVVRLYVEEDDIVDAGVGMVNNFVQNVHHYDDKGKTLSLLDMSRYDDLVEALDPVVSTLGEKISINPNYSDSLINASINAQSYGESPKGDQRATIDLQHFTRLISEQVSDTELSPYLDELIEATEQFVVHSNHDGSRPHSFGIAIDAPENADPEYSAYKINDTWLDFQVAFGEFRLGDTESPEVIVGYVDTDGLYASVYDENLAFVNNRYGWVEEIEWEDGAFEDFFMVIAEEEPTQLEDGVFLAHTWDQWWFTVEFAPEQETTWIPALLDGTYEEDGQEYKIYVAEIDYYQSDKDYTNSELPYDFATMTLIVDEGRVVVGYDIATYQYLFSGPDDEVGEIQFDKATFQIRPGDALQFWNLGLSLEDAANDQWFEASEVITFVQEPVFQLEFLEFEDQFGAIIDYYYAIWAEDASGNATLSELQPSEWIVDSPYGNMIIFRDPAGYFQVETPQDWIDLGADPSIDDIFAASDIEADNHVSIYVTEGIQTSLAEYADAFRSALLEEGATDIAVEEVETAQGYPAILGEMSVGEYRTTRLILLHDDGNLFTVAYTFPIEQFETAKELAYYSFDTFLFY